MHQKEGRGRQAGELSPGGWARGSDKVAGAPGLLPNVCVLVCVCACVEGAQRDRAVAAVIPVQTGGCVGHGGGGGGNGVRECCSKASAFRQGTWLSRTIEQRRTRGEQESEAVRGEWGLPLTVRTHHVASWPRVIACFGMNAAAARALHHQRNMQWLTAPTHNWSQ